ncbi:MAG TPA: 1-(5-phosphoribosyl)-5-amino-4-imidazole-carboxylate carboxylase, partial [bacterium (Candidatus Stahlbacteria)]|nr:1-(5-phosphoribosyl)-5-amino-4-imidazole-carboxylate carboxylase [Candidatus Stahlbacteria bacterium]
MTELLKEIYEKKMTPEEFMKIYKFQPFLELGDVCLDLHRSLRKGFPEVVFCPGKSLDRIKKIARNLYRYHRLVLLTKADLRIARSLKKIFPKLKYFPEARIILIGRKRKKTGGKTGVITGGSSDIPIAEEAAVTCEVMGREVKRFYDVGVAGIHRLTHIIDEIARCQVLIVVAGMEGALPSIISG